MKVVKSEGVCLVLPIRLNSTRFNNKFLIKFNNKTLLEHSIDIGKKLNFIDKIVVATDESNNEIDIICKKNNVDLLIIKEKVSCGSEKIFYVKKKYKNFEYYISFPVDEPTINPNELNRIWKENFIWFKDHYIITTLYSDFYNIEDLKSYFSCKIVTDKSDNIKYTSRAIIPFSKNGKINDLKYYKKHIGIFIFPAKLLEEHKLKLWEENELSKLEGLEQNMFLNFNFNCYKIKHIGFGIDIKEQIELLEKRVNL